jgi:hypothetical protein
MIRTIHTILLLSTLVDLLPAMESDTCKACHPTIVAEYQRSVHANSSIYTDTVHRALWEKHPLKKKGAYACAACHTPSDPAVTGGKGLPGNNAAQRREPISCTGCHKIKSIEKHAKANRTIYSDRKRTFFSVDPVRRGEKVKFTEKKSFFGLFSGKSGSPYHDIDYSDPVWYDGQICMGCHSHAQNAKGFTTCDLEVKQGDSKETCVSCHMPRRPGTLANQKQSRTHADHSMNFHAVSPAELGHYLHLDLKQKEEGFLVTIKNDATHTLFPHPLRLAQLKATIYRKGKKVDIPPVSFIRRIGRDGRPAPSWLADSVLKDTTIKALETQKVTFDTPLHPGDRVVLEFGYRRVDPKMAQKLGIDDPEATKFRIMKRKEIVIEK